MAKVKVEVEFTLDDYFSKYGFGDGDDGAASDYGYSYRDVTVEALNKAFKKYKLPLRADIDEVSSIHNNCRIAVYRVDGTEENEIDIDEGDSDSLSNTERVGLKKAFAEVDAWLDREVK